MRNPETQNNSLLPLLVGMLYKGDVFGEKQTCDPGDATMMDYLTNLSLKTEENLIRQLQADRYPVKLAKDVVDKTVSIINGAAPVLNLASIEDSDGPIARSLGSLALLYAEIQAVDHILDRDTDVQGKERIITSLKASASPLVQGIYSSIEALTVGEDLKTILRLQVIVDTLLSEVRYQELSHSHSELGFPADYVEQNAQELATLRIGNVCLMPAVLVLNDLHAGLGQAPRAMPILESDEARPVRDFVWAVQAFIGAIDDLGDKEIDTGKDSRWGEYSINMWNVGSSILVEEMLVIGGLVSGEEVKEVAAQLMSMGNEARGLKLVELIRSKYNELGEDVKKKYKVILQYVKNIAEGGYLGRISDKGLAGV